MTHKIARIIIIGCSIFLLIAAQSPATAQDTGTPVMQEVTMYAGIGMLVGAALGVAIWMLDPLAPSANILLSVSNGLAIGSVGGVIFGAMQLSQQAIIPYQAPTGQYDDYDLDAFLFAPIDDPDFDYAAALKEPRPSSAPVPGSEFTF